MDYNNKLIAILKKKNAECTNQELINVFANSLKNALSTDDSFDFVGFMTIAKAAEDSILDRMKTEETEEPQTNKDYFDKDEFSNVLNNFLRGL